MESIREVIKPHVDHSTGKVTERAMYEVVDGHQIFETRELAVKALITKFVITRLNADEDLKKKCADVGRSSDIHLRLSGALFEFDYEAVIQCNNCDPSMKKLAKEVIALRCNP